jgi:hypothetical protein
MAGFEVITYGRFWPITEGNKTPMIIAGTAKNCFRMMGAIDKHWPEVSRDVLFELDLVRRATRIEGRSAQLFYLARALIRGPVPDDPDRQPGELRMSIR